MTDKELEIHQRIFFQTQGKFIGLIPVECYDYLVSEGEIDLTIEEKQVIREQTEKRLEVEAEKEGFIAQKEHAHLKTTKLFEAKIRTECKRQAVANYFIKQKMMEDF